MVPKPIDFSKVAIAPAEDAPSTPRDRVLEREDQEEIMPLQKRHAKDFLRCFLRKIACKVVTFRVFVTLVTAAFGVVGTLLIVFFVSGWPTKRDDAHNVAGAFISSVRESYRLRCARAEYITCNDNELCYKPFRLGVYAHRRKPFQPTLEYVRIDSPSHLHACNKCVVFVHVGRTLAPSRTPPLAAAAFSLFSERRGSHYSARFEER